MITALTNDEIEGRFFLSGRMEIQSVLNELVHRREAVSVHFNGGREFLLTILLEVRPDVLVFDLGGSQAANESLLKSSGGVMVSSPDGIRVQFPVGQVHRFRWGDNDAFWVALPERVVRMQRREYFRVLASRARPQFVDVLVDEGVPLLRAKLYDIGVGGIGVSTVAIDGLIVDTVIQDVTLLLPDFGEISCAAVVRHVTRIGEERGKPLYRVGLRFAGLGRTTEVKIQRYIVHIEQERRRLAAGG